MRPQGENDFISRGGEEEEEGRRRRGGRGGGGEEEEEEEVVSNICWRVMKPPQVNLRDVHQ